MKAAVFFFAALACGARAELAIPIAFEKERYVETLSQSPFALAIDPGPTPPPLVPSVLDKLVVTGLGKLDDGRDFVVLQQQGEPLSIRLEGTQTSNGLTVTRVNWGDRWRVSTVLVTDGVKEKSIVFDQSARPTNKSLPPNKPLKPVKRDAGGPVLTR